MPEKKIAFLYTQNKLENEILNTIYNSINIRKYLEIYFRKYV